MPPSASNGLDVLPAPHHRQHPGGGSVQQGLSTAGDVLGFYQHRNVADKLFVRPAYYTTQMKKNLVTILLTAAIQTGCATLSEPIEPTAKAEDPKVNRAPLYPLASRRAGEEGQVIVKALINESGSPIKVEIKQSSGFDQLDKAALDAVRNWRFIPAKRGVKPIEAWINIPIRFRLDAGTMSKLPT